MIANALRVEIDRYAGRIRSSNALFSKAADGTLTKACIAVYLTNVHHLICHTQPNLVRARDRARALGDEALAGHYEHKRTEEAGHEVWAERDLERVAAGRRDVVPAMRELLSYLERTIDADPALYLSYILFAEYLLIVLAPEWLALLEERCGIPRTSMTVIGNHVELDKGHVEEAFDRIDDLVGDPAKLPAMRQVLLATCASFDRFCGEVIAAADAEKAA